jgi:hypothetical protein
LGMDVDFRFKLLREGCLRGRPYVTRKKRCVETRDCLLNFKLM